MKRRGQNLLIPTVLLILSCVAAASPSTSSTTLYQHTTRLNASINMTYSGPSGNFSILSGEWFNISASVRCNTSYCGIVTIYPVYCSGLGCAKFTNIEVVSNAPIYTKNETPYRCLGVDVGGKCAYSWNIRAVKTGVYTLMFAVSSDHTAPIYSGFMDVRVRGCGDGICNESENESYDRCPEDCCDDDCTATYDITCHKRCNGFNGCSLASGCDGRLNTYKACLSPTVYLRCCETENIRCEYETYCSDASCYNCSIKCDGECQSAACFGLDPDCSRNGEATMPCCGNRRLDVGEECDWGVSGTRCDRSCLPNCTCAPDVTTPPRRTTTTIVIATTQTTRNPWIRNPNFTDIYITSTLPPINFTEPERFFPNIDLMPLLLIPAAIALLAALVYTYRYYCVWSARKSYELLKNRENTLKKLIEAVSGEYQSQRLTAEEASKKIFEYEKELYSVREKMEKALMRLNK